ncbi:uncharacterized protein LOC142533364 isoform X1 [Primulina tabacum]|uniref:uncharacterized protein LOC142533364 isoform X1 n=1 Tax=Primulina tabacum TaxID=48773 RepID=UPI003F5A3872
MAQSYSSQSMMQHVKPEINLTDQDLYLREKPGGIAILSDLANHVEALSVSKEDHCPYTCHLGSRLLLKLEEENFEVLEFDFSTGFLSPVREQKMMYVCGHISALASVEMVFRQCGITIDGS